MDFFFPQYLNVFTLLICASSVLIPMELKFNFPPEIKYSHADQAQYLLSGVHYITKAVWGGYYSDSE